MKKMIINGREIKTNLGAKDYPFGTGENTATMHIEVKKSFSESDEDFVARLADSGYTHISLKLCTTAVRGFYEVYALVNDLY